MNIELNNIKQVLYLKWILNLIKKIMLGQYFNKCINHLFCFPKKKTCFIYIKNYVFNTKT